MLEEKLKNNDKMTKINLITAFNSASLNLVILGYIFFGNKFRIILQLSKNLKEIAPPSAYPMLRVVLASSRNVTFVKTSLLKIIILCTPSQVRLTL